jgi:hypothetical protein
MAQKVYNADEIQMAFGPVLIESGLGDDEFCRVEQESDDTEDVVGVDGEVTVSRTNDRRATITFLVMSSSISNDGLTTLSNLVKTAPGMAGGVHPVVIRDPNGRTIMEGANAWIRRAPDRSFARTANVNEWQIRVANLVRNDGGN